MAERQALGRLATDHTADQRQLVGNVTSRI